MMEAVKDIIEQTPPELLADIMGSGIYLVGGGALLAGLDVLLSAATRMKVKIIEDPLTAVVRGGGIVLENLDTLREVLADTSSGVAIK
ncbi:MAG: rod shape-determining protein, partial [Patescibacteria group bacterium]